MTTVFEASVRNESGIDGNIIRGEELQLRWSDIEHMHCTECGNEIKLGEWSYVRFTFPPPQYVRYCDLCKSKRRSEGMLYF